MKEIRTLPFLGLLAILPLGSCANRQSSDRVATCASAVLPRYRTCIERVASELKQCEQGYRFYAGHWCRKKVSVVELTKEEVLRNSSGCEAKGYPLDSPACRRDATDLVHDLQARTCEDSLWLGLEEWAQPTKSFTACKTGVACCQGPAKKSNNDCDAAASSAILQCAQPAAR